MNRWLAAVLLSLVPLSLLAQERKEEDRREKPDRQPKLQAITLPAVGGSYVDPSTGNRIWRVSDRGLCTRGAKHYYSYWPVWNADGSHLLVECQGWLGSRDSSTILLVRDKDLKVVGDALGSARSFNKGHLFWSWKDPQAFYAFRDSEVWKWNPFSGKGSRIASLDNLKVGESSVRSIVLAYVSFDDRYLLLELQGPNLRRQKPNPHDTLGLLTYDMQAGKVAGLLDITTWRFYDEAVFTKDNHVWVRMTDDAGAPQSLRFSLDFSERNRVAEGGHHAHGILPDGSPVAVKEASNRDCPPGSPSGNPNDKEYPAKGWKPTAVLLDPRVDTAGAERNAPIASILFKLGCQIKGQHEFSHFSWNNSQPDVFFGETWSYGSAEGNPIADAIIRVRLKFDGGGKISGDEIDVLAHHRSDKRHGYWATPRVSCNQQGTRCLFASAMSNGANDSDGGPNLYIVDVPKR
ncbi:MAG: hypothetical protein HY234_02575 [Acidobacteria bacterium]|nr:hypothetical protein [Acidobacteriota bacterium]MBI3661920.1 hypothetical protein [Acidobacteriota bacterium]